MKAEASIGMGLAVGVVVWSIYSHAMPSLVDHRVGDVNDVNAQKAERTATWTAAGVVAGISLLAKDPTVFVLGGSMVVVLSFWHRHANMVNPLTARATAPMPVDTGALGDEQVSPDAAYVGA
jgi:hypothetical protein